MPTKLVSILRIVLWLVILTGFVRGLWAFDSGGSANTHETVAAGLCFAASLISATLLFCFDRRTPTAP